MRALTPALLGAAWAACATPRPRAPGSPRTAEDLAAGVAEVNDGWRTLRARTTLTLELFPPTGTAAGTERRRFRADLLAERPSRLRIGAGEDDRPLFDLLWLGATPQLARPLPEEERSSRLREVLASLAEDLRVALRLGRDGPTRVEMRQAPAAREGGGGPAYELREYEGRALVARATVERETLLRRRLEQGRDGRLERTIHFAGHAPAGPTNLARLIVVDNERFDYSLRIEILDVALDEPIDATRWAP